MTVPLYAVSSVVDAESFIAIGAGLVTDHRNVSLVDNAPESVAVTTTVYGPL